MNQGRSYLTPPAQLICPECKHIFYHAHKLKSHIESQHYLATRRFHKYTNLDLNDELKIYTAASHFLHDLLFNNSNPHYLQHLKQSRLLIHCDWRLAFRDFYTFINMGLPYFDTSFQPTLLIDFLLQAVILKGHFVPLAFASPFYPFNQQKYLYFRDVFLDLTNREPYIPTPCSDDNDDLYPVVEQLRNLPSQILQEIQDKAEAAKKLKEAKDERSRKESEAIKKAIEDTRKEVEAEKEAARRKVIDNAKSRIKTYDESAYRAFKTYCGRISPTVEQCFRYQTISTNHPTLDTYTHILMATVQLHQCRLCDPPLD